MSKFVNFSANVQNAFENNESDYLNFSQLLKDARTGVFQSGITAADAKEMIQEKFRLIMGVDENASQKEIRRAIERHRQELFEVIEDAVDDMLTKYSKRYKKEIKKIRKDIQNGKLFTRGI